MTWLLGILGLGGVGIVATFLLGGGPMLMLYGAKALGFAKTIPPKVWYALAIVAALAGAYFLHGHQVKKHDDVVRSAEDQVWQKKLDAAVAAVKVKDAQLAGISAQLRKANDEANNSIATDAAALRVRGPGAAACSRVGSPPTSAGRSQPASTKRDAAGPALPATNWQDMLAAVDWNWLTDRAEEHDQLRAEALSWREWYARQRANWPKGAAEKP